MTLRSQQFLCLVLVAFCGSAKAQRPALKHDSVILDDIDAWGLYPEFGRLPGSNEPVLLVGTSATLEEGFRGRLRVLKNVGTSEKPRYSDGYWLDEKIPSARIPKG